MCYLSLHDNRHIRYYKGHTKPICALDISPIDDTVITGSLDNTVRLWDLRVPDHLAIVNHVNAPVPYASFDPMGILFALITSPNQVKLFNLRQLELGPFDEFTVRLHSSPVPPPVNSQPTFDTNYGQQIHLNSCKFDPTGQLMLLTCNDGSAYLLDAFSGKTKHIFHPSQERQIIPSLSSLSSNMNNNSSRSQAIFTPDSQYVFMGTQSGSIYCWKTETGELIHQWLNIHNGPVTNLQFNPVYLNMVSSSNHLSMWIMDEQQQGFSPSLEIETTIDHHSFSRTSHGLFDHTSLNANHIPT